MLDFIEESPFNGKEPKKLMIFLHGYGSNKEDLFNLKNSFLDILPDTHFMSVDAPFPCEFESIENSRQWFSLKSMDINYILEEMKKHYFVLNKFINEQIKRLNLKPENVILVGFSQGAMMALYASLRYNGKLLGVVSFSGLLADTYQNLKEELKTKQEILLIHGVDDNVVPFEYATRTEELLKSLDINHYLITCFDLEHQIDMFGIKKAREFILNLI